MPETTNAQLAAQVTELLALQAARDTEFGEWIAGTAAGGPNSDGRYPLTNPSGTTQLLECPAKLADNVLGPTATAQSASDSAASALASVQSIEASLVTLTSSVDTKLAQAVAARDLALQYRDQAANHFAAADAARVAAEAARDATLQALADWEANNP